MTNHEILEHLRGMVTWNSFAASLVVQFDRKGSLSPRQWEAAANMIAKMERNERSKAACSRDGVDLGKVKAIFENAKKSGLKWPKLHLAGLILSLAGDRSRNPGAIYIKSEDTADYLGKVSDGRFHAAAAATPQVGETLAKLAADPLGAITEHGHLTGNCACCHRKLTDPESVKRGVGPVCAERWGL